MRELPCRRLSYGRGCHEIWWDGGVWLCGKVVIIEVLVIRSRRRLDDLTCDELVIEMVLAVCTDEEKVFRRCGLQGSSWRGVEPKQRYNRTSRRWRCCGASPWPGKPGRTVGAITDCPTYPPSSSVTVISQTNSSAPFCKRLRGAFTVPALHISQHGSSIPFGGRRGDQRVPRQVRRES